MLEMESIVDVWERWELVELREERVKGVWRGKKKRKKEEEAVPLEYQDTLAEALRMLETRHES